MGVMNRANKHLGGGDYITGPQKDDLIRFRTPMAIVNVDYDATGSSQYPGARWLISIEPWEAEKFPCPTGVLSFKNNPSRQGQFEDVQNQLEESKAQDPPVPYIGPVALISIPNKRGGNPIKTLADVLFDETSGAILLDPRGFPRIDGEVEPPPPPAPAPTPTPAPTGPRRPTGQTQAAPQAPAAPAAAPAVPAAQQPEPAPEAATPAPARRGRRPAAQAAAPAGPASSYEAQQLAQEAATPVSGPPPGQPEIAQVIPMATAVCPYCKVEIGPNRVYPAQGGGHVIMHAHCPVKQDTVILPVVLEEGAA